MSSTTDNDAITSTAATTSIQNKRRAVVGADERPVPVAGAPLTDDANAGDDSSSSGGSKHARTTRNIFIFETHACAFFCAQ
jgi:hypothetical protein